MEKRVDFAPGQRASPQRFVIKTTSIYPQKQKKMVPNMTKRTSQGIVFGPFATH
jgi:hypothetical protein